MKKITEKKKTSCLEACKRVKSRFKHEISNLHTITTPAPVSCQKHMMTKLDQMNGWGPR